MKPESRSYYGHKLSLGLKESRILANLSQADVAERAHMGVQRVSRLESGQLPNCHEMLALLKMYGVSGEKLSHYTNLLKMAKLPRWWTKYRLKNTRYIGMEDAADCIYEFQLGYVPELLQTAEYARTALSCSGEAYTDRELNAHVEARMRRQEQLKGDHPLTLHALMHEGILSQEAVDRDQIFHLIDLTAMENVAFQIVPHSAGMHAGYRGSFALMSFFNSDEPEVAFGENPIKQTESHRADRMPFLKNIFDSLQKHAWSRQVTRSFLRERLQSS